MELPRTDWLKAEHVDALKTAIGTTTDRMQRRRLRECLALLCHAHARVVGATAEDAIAEREVPLINHDFDTLKYLVTKGIQHNAAMPDMSPIDMARAVGVCKELIARAQFAAFSLDDLDLLEQVFHVAADFDDRNRFDVRQLEQKVRLGLGLPPRLDLSPKMDEVA